MKGAIHQEDRIAKRDTQGSNYIVFPFADQRHAFWVAFFLLSCIQPYKQISYRLSHQKERERGEHCVPCSLWKKRLSTLSRCTLTLCTSAPLGVCVGWGVWCGTYVWVYVVCRDGSCTLCLVSWQVMSLSSLSPTGSLLFLPWNLTAAAAQASLKITPCWGHLHLLSNPHCAGTQWLAGPSTHLASCLGTTLNLAQ